MSNNGPDTSPAPLPLTTMRTLLAKRFPEVRWLLHRIVPTRGVAFVVSKPKVGKTQLCLNFALCIARGKPFLHRHTHRGPVIYLALEGDEQDLQERLAALEATEDDDLHLYVEPLVPKDIIKRLAVNVSQIRPRAIFVDTFVRFTNVEDVNRAYSEVYNLIAPVQKLCAAFDTAALFTHHAGKAERDDPFDATIGTTGLRGMVDATMLLIKDPKNGKRFLAVEQRAFNGEDISLTELIMNGTTGNLTLGQKRTAADSQALAQSILAFLRHTENGATERRVLGAVSGNRQKIIGKIEDSVKNGEITRATVVVPDSMGRKFKRQHLVPVHAEEGPTLVWTQDGAEPGR